MEENNTTIKECYELFKLDERASKSEVEIAFDVLTSSKNLPAEQYRCYRLAFEFLMKEVYHELTTIEEQEEIENEKFSSVVNVIPECVKKGIESWERFNDEELSDKVKALFATQKVNLPMFFDAILKNSRRFINFFFWTSKDIDNIVEQTCLNPLSYNDITFELTYNGIECIDRYIDLRDFVNNIKKMYSKDKFLCKKFICHNTQFGIMGHCILEHSLAEGMVQMFRTKAKQVDCCLNLTMSNDGC